MPGPDGKLTAEEQGRAAAWIAKHHKDHCPSCGEGPWIVPEHLVQPVTLGADQSLVLGGPGYPQVMLLCRTCGHTLFFNAVVMGLIKPGSSSEPEKKG